MVDRLNIPPPTRVAVGVATITTPQGKQRVEVFIDSEWARYFESLTAQVNTTTAAVGLPGAPGATGAAGAGVSFGDSGGEEAMLVPGPKGDQGEQGGQGAAIAWLASEESAIEFIPGPKGNDGAPGAAGPVVALLASEDGAVEFVPGPKGDTGATGAPGPVVAFMLEADSPTEHIERPVGGGIPLTDAATVTVAQGGTAGTTAATARTGLGYVASSFTATATGFTTSPTCTVKYEIWGNMVVLNIQGGISATSNATTFTLTGVPAAITPVTTQNVIARVSDSGGASVFGLAQVNTTNVLTFFKDANGGAFTGSGTKALAAQSFAYLLS